MASGYEKSLDYGGSEPMLWINLVWGAFVAAIVAVTFASPIWPSKAQAQGIVVSGQLDCGQWIKARTQSASRVYEGYLQGFLNGLAVGKGEEFWAANGGSISPEAVFLWMDGYCREHPLDSIVTAAFVLYKERSGWTPD